MIKYTCKQMRVNVMISRWMSLRKDSVKTNKRGSCSATVPSTTGTSYKTR